MLRGAEGRREWGCLPPHVHLGVAACTPCHLDVGWHPRMRRCGRAGGAGCRTAGVKRDSREVSASRGRRGRMARVRARAHPGLVGVANACTMGTARVDVSRA